MTYFWKAIPQDHWYSKMRYLWGHASQYRYIDDKSLRIATQCSNDKPEILGFGPTKDPQFWTIFPSIEVELCSLKNARKLSSGIPNLLSHRSPWIWRCGHQPLQDSGRTGGIWYVLVPLDTHLTLKTETKDIHPEVLVEAIPKPELHVGKHQGVTILYII